MRDAGGARDAVLVTERHALSPAPHRFPALPSLSIARTIPVKCTLALALELFP